ncbi:MAG: hypothetical protein M3R34_03465 [Acidobacteriota bacterium]|nr:hypothetical protein [Acidobacteriota bacterium]
MSGRSTRPVESKRPLHTIPWRTTPAVLFTANPPPDDYDVAPDGRRFLFLEQALERDVPLTVVVNWTAERKKP